MIVDYDGRIVSQATPGDGEKMVVGPVDVEMLRMERETRQAHQMLVHLRSEVHTRRPPVYPAGLFGQGEGADWTYEANARGIERARRVFKERPAGEDDD